MIWLSNKSVVRNTWKKQVIPIQSFFPSSCRLKSRFLVSISIIIWKPKKETKAMQETSSRCYDARCRLPLDGYQHHVSYIPTLVVHASNTTLECDEWVEDIRLLQHMLLDLFSFFFLFEFFWPSDHHMQESFFKMHFFGFLQLEFAFCFP